VCAHLPTTSSRLASVISAFAERVSCRRLLDRQWYTFSELRWQVEFIAGPRAGRSGSLATAEIIALDHDGPMYAHVRFGTQLLS
jgi:hypothetical protein